jgi:Spy/CpxP family protein refolding chaperone
VTQWAKRAWLLAFVVLVFSLGFGAGVIMGPMLGLAATRWPPPPPSPSGLVAMFAKQLDLTIEQQQRVEKILLARRQTFGTFSEDVRQRMDAERDAMLAEIDQILTPEQRVRFQMMNQKMREHRRSFPPFAPLPPPPR